jgi:hypothetical protein
MLFFRRNLGLTLKFFLRYTCQFHDRPLQASFEILIPVNGNSDSQVASLTDIDVVATGYTSQTPSFPSRIWLIRLPLIIFMSDGNLHDRVTLRNRYLGHVDA